MNFIEESPREQGFAQYYAENIKPKADFLEKERLKYLGYVKITKICTVLVAIFIFLLLISGSLPVEVDFKAFPILIFVSVVVFLLPDQIYLDHFSRVVKANSMDNILGFFGDLIYKKEGSDYFKSYIKFDILPHHNWVTASDTVKGDYKGVGFVIEKLVLAKNTLGINFDRGSSAVRVAPGANPNAKKNTTTNVFSGLVVMLEFNKNFSCRTVVRKDHNVFNFLHKNAKFDDRKMENVKLEDPKFEKMFEVYSDDQIESRHLLTTSFMERLIALSELFFQAKIECSFVDNMFLLLIPYDKDLFATNHSLHEPFDMIGQCKTIIQEIGLIFDIIDVLELDQKTGM